MQTNTAKKLNKKQLWAACIAAEADMTPEQIKSIDSVPKQSSYDEARRLHVESNEERFFNKYGAR
jgi:hypothetical protein